MVYRTKGKVLIIYTGGTIGSFPKDRSNQFSPLIPASLGEIMDKLPNYDLHEQKIRIEDKIIKIGTYSFRKPVDSSDLQVENWVEIARTIHNNYAKYDGFVILHGTDILAYTASALAFMFENLGKPVVLTGSQRPISQTRTDATQNIVTAIEIASAKSLGHPVIPEVCVVFGNEIYRGCRSTKIDASGYKAFDSPDYPPLGKVGMHVKVAPGLLASMPASEISHTEKLERNVASIVIFPGMNIKLLENILSVDGLKGVVLQTYGSGNTPTHLEFLETIYKAIQRGIIVVDVTQCKAGEVELGLYQTSEKLLSQGVISGLDMTPEAALVKLMVVLGQNNEREVAEDLLQINLRGEQSRSVFNLHFPKGRIESKSNMTFNQNHPMTLGHERFNPELVDIALLRIAGLRVSGKCQKGEINLSFYVDLPDSQKAKPANNPHFLCSISKFWTDKTGWESSLVPITEKILPFIDNKHINTITVVNRGSRAVKWEKLEFVFYTRC